VERIELEELAAGLNHGGTIEMRLSYFAAKHQKEVRVARQKFRLVSKIG
jgi:hypothetical protein